MADETKEQIEKSRNNWRNWGIFSIIYFILSLFIIIILIIIIIRNRQTVKEDMRTLINSAATNIANKTSGGCGCSSITGGCNCSKGGAKNSTNFLKSLM